MLHKKGEMILVIWFKTDANKSKFTDIKYEKLEDLHLLKIIIL